MILNHLNVYLVIKVAIHAIILIKLAWAVSPAIQKITKLAFVYFIVATIRHIGIHNLKHVNLVAWQFKIAINARINHIV